MHLYNVGKTWVGKCFPFHLARFQQIIKSPPECMELKNIIKQFGIFTEMYRYTEDRARRFRIALQILRPDAAVCTVQYTLLYSALASSHTLLVNSFSATPLCAEFDQNSSTCSSSLIQFFVLASVLFVSFLLL